MKRITLIETKITNSQTPADFTLDYQREFLRLVEMVPEGITASQMGTAIKLAQKLQHAQTGDQIILEDAEWEYLNGKLAAAKFSFIAPEIVRMVESVAQAEDVGATLIEEKRRRVASRD